MKKLMKILQKKSPFNLTFKEVLLLTKRLLLKHGHRTDSLDLIWKAFQKADRNRRVKIVEEYIKIVDETL